MWYIVYYYFSINSAHGLYGPLLYVAQVNISTQ